MQVICRDALGHVHLTRRTPTVSIMFWSLVVAAFVIWGYYDEKAILVAVVTCNLTALLWYVLAMVCLMILRVKAPDMPRPYKSPWYPALPIVVAGMSLFAAVLCVWYPSAELESHNWFSDYVVLWLTLAMYGIGLLYYFGFAHAPCSCGAGGAGGARSELMLHRLQHEAKRNSSKSSEFRYYRTVTVR